MASKGFSSLNFIQITMTNHDLLKPSCVKLSEILSLPQTTAIRQVAKLD
jgi:hypothetical protein